MGFIGPARPEFVIRRSRLRRLMSHVTRISAFVIVYIDISTRCISFVPMPTLLRRIKMAQKQPVQRPRTTNVVCFQDVTFVGILDVDDVRCAHGVFVLVHKPLYPIVVLLSHVRCICFIALLPHLKCAFSSFFRFFLRFFLRQITSVLLD